MAGPADAVDPGLHLAGQGSAAAAAACQHLLRALPRQGVEDEDVGVGRGEDRRVWGWRAAWSRGRTPPSAATRPSVPRRRRSRARRERRAPPRWSPAGAVPRSRPRARAGSAAASRAPPRSTSYSAPSASSFIAVRSARPKPSRRRSGTVIAPLRHPRPPSARIALGGARPLLLRHAVEHRERQHRLAVAGRLALPAAARHAAAATTESGAEPGEGSRQRLEGQHAARQEAPRRAG